MNDIHVTLRGNVATAPKHLQFEDGNTLTSFRLASNSRYRDRERHEWVDRGTTYVTVNCRWAMAANVAGSVRKGHPVVVTGTLRERFWTSGERSGQSLVVEAVTIGHDLSYGTTDFVRTERIRSDERSAGQAATDVSDLTVLDDVESAMAADDVATDALSADDEFARHDRLDEYQSSGLNGRSGPGGEPTKLSELVRDAAVA
jgi:single-strand DNA-binding protein